MNDRRREQKRASSKKRRDSEKGRNWNKEYLSRPEVKSRLAEHRKKYYIKNRGNAAYQQKKREQSLRYYRKYRAEALAAYGNKCACCGETEPAFLSFDHINGGGERERKVGMQGTTLYRRIIKDRPSDVQILCHNCNMAKGFYGTCPHEDQRRKIK
jgi:hypothetical protein